jgi:hypothetical protein
MRFDPRPDRLLASRSFAFTFLLSTANGRDYYEVKYKEENGGTIVSLATELRSSTGLFPTVGNQPAFLSEISIVGSEVPWRAPTIFFERLEYFLGLRSTWTTCAELKSRSKVKKEKYQPPAEFCGGMSGGLGNLISTQSLKRIIAYAFDKAGCLKRDVGIKSSLFQGASNRTGVTGNHRGLAAKDRWGLVHLSSILAAL